MSCRQQGLSGGSTSQSAGQAAEFENPAFEGWVGRGVCWQVHLYAVQAVFDLEFAGNVHCCWCTDQVLEACCWLLHCCATKRAPAGVLCTSKLPPSRQLGPHTHHVPCCLCLCHALGCQFREITAALDAPLSVPSALTVPHQHDSLAGCDAGQPQRGLVLCVSGKKAAAALGGGGGSSISRRRK
jgi:hypothetical protein